MMNLFHVLKKIYSQIIAGNKDEKCMKKLQFIFGYDSLSVTSLRHGVGTTQTR